MCDCEELVQALIDSGIDVNSTLDSGDGLSHSVLYAAVRPGAVDMIRFLLKRGAFADAWGIDTFGKAKTALHRTVGAGDQAMVRLLLDHGADANLKSEIWPEDQDP